MQNLFDINKLWFSGILSDLSDSELKAAYDVLQQFFVICDLADVCLYYELFDLLEDSLETEIRKRYFKNVS